MKFWPLLSGGVAVFAWLVLFSYYAKVWGRKTQVGQTIPSITSIPTVTHNDDHRTARLATLPYADVWFALALMAAIDAFVIAINFNRSLIHQSHYFINVRMTLLAFIISAAVEMVHINEPETLRPAQYPITVICFCCI